ncbi:MAG TPA: cytochrome c biogenesis protein ResB [Thermomicrobiales bacterium]|nr:cytochrome c biogenesis protein ResB [Thermomicrobiales bacterium]
MAQATLEKRGFRNAPLETAVDRIWRFFCSVRAAVVEIAILAVLVLIGTLRGSSVPRSIADNIPGTTTIVDRWYDWDVFHSIPFMFILGVLTVAITVCTMNRAPGIWRTINEPTVTTTRGFIRNAEVSAYATLASPMDEAVKTYTAALKKRRYRVLSQPSGDAIHVYADKNRWAKLATFPFHLALILILVGGIVGARYGFKENEFIVPEGSVRDVGHGTGLSVKLEQFNDSWREDGSPASYRSDLILYKNGKEVKEQSITVNNPMSYGTTTFYQTSFGQAAEFRVLDQGGNVIYNDSIDLGTYRATSNPDAPAGIIDLTPLGIQLNVIAPDDDRANAPMLDTLNLQSGQMYVQVKSLAAAAGTTMPDAVLNQGQPLQVGDYTVEFVRENRYTLLQVARNPGVPIFWIAAFLLVGGLFVTFYLPHRRIRAIFDQNGPQGATQLAMAPLAKRDWSGQKDFRNSVAELSKRFGAELAIREPAETNVGAAGNLTTQ